MPNPRRRTSSRYSPSAHKTRAATPTQPTLGELETVVVEWDWFPDKEIALACAAEIARVLTWYCSKSMRPGPGGANEARALRTVELTARDFLAALKALPETTRLRYSLAVAAEMSPTGKRLPPESHVQFSADVDYQKVMERHLTTARESVAGAARAGKLLGLQVRRGAPKKGTLKTLCLLLYSVLHSYALPAARGNQEALRHLRNDISECLCQILDLANIKYPDPGESASRFRQLLPPHPGNLDAFVAIPTILDAWLAEHAQAPRPSRPG